jgi:hypothetical protein
MLAGDFTAFASPACNGGRQIALRAPFVNNRLSPTLFSPAALKIAQKLPSTADPCGAITYGAPADDDEWQAVAKIDYQINANHTVFGRYLHTDSSAKAAWPRTENILTTAVRGRPKVSTAKGPDPGRHARLRFEHGQLLPCGAQPDARGYRPRPVPRRAVGRQQGLHIHPGSDRAGRHQRVQHRHWRLGENST